MARGRLDPHVAAHVEWLDYVVPTGLVVSATALASRGAILDRHDREGHERLRDLLHRVPQAPAPDARKASDLGAAPFGGSSATARRPAIRDFSELARDVLGWSLRAPHYVGPLARSPQPSSLEVHLPSSGRRLAPDLAVADPEPADGAVPWQLLVRVLPPGVRPDEVPAGARDPLSPHSEMERLLRETRVPAGLVVSEEALRLVSAPRGENSGWIDFRAREMVETGGRPIAAALRLLLSERRLLTLPRAQRLSALLLESREHQNSVSERLSEQVLHALYELLRGLQAADGDRGGALLRAVVAQRPEDVYHGLLTVVLRLVFLLYAEERDLLPQAETFRRAYALGALHARLREDAALHPDTMDRRYGAWAQLLALFRMVHDGAVADGLRLPARLGVLFDPDRFPFLEGRAPGRRRAEERVLDVPLVPDGAVFRALENLRILDGERLSYRALDVEQIGSVYETMMGFKVEVATGPSLALRARSAKGAPTTIDLAQLLGAPARERVRWLEERADRPVPAATARALAAASSVDDLHHALSSLVDRHATPDVVPEGALVLQPGAARRRSASHYTPRSLTEPIVQTTLAPLLERLRGEAGAPPRPEAILDLKVCDPAMGSGAFLVQACRHLADRLVEAWHAHGARPDVPPDEDEVVHARRLVALRCLYGVDRNPMAVDLAKVSLWLATLAAGHPLTFVDHALRHGDSLVGLSRREFEALDWDGSKPRILKGLRVAEALDEVAALRTRIRDAGDRADDDERHALFAAAEQALDRVRLYGDLVVGAWFQGASAREREAKRERAVTTILAGRAEAERPEAEARRRAEPPLVPFHWEIEFPEVFERDNPGFDAFVGNPPFAGKNAIASGNPDRYPVWLKERHVESHGNADLAAHFFRRAYRLLRRAGTFGLVATNTIAQGDTRASGLRWICMNGGTIYAARKRVPWPGEAAVVVSVVHGAKEAEPTPRVLDGVVVPTITAYLLPRGDHADPLPLSANAGQSFQGSIVLGMGFTFDDTDRSGTASTLAEMRALIEQDPRNHEVIVPYIGGEELNSDPSQRHHRFVINFGTRTEQECRRRWPALLTLVERRVRPDREDLHRDAYRQLWWQFGEKRAALWRAVGGLRRVLAVSRVGQHATFAFLPTGMVYAESLVVFPFETHAALCALQSRLHETWARFFGSSMRDDLRYTPSDCFETFPFPEGWATHPALEAAGRAYHDFRADLMVRTQFGLTKTYNRFHDPEEGAPDIERLRALHADLDRAVLAAYGWSDLVERRCDFVPEHAEDAEEVGSEGGRRRRVRHRYRWPDETVEEVLARLLDLNAARARAEARAGAGAAARARSDAAPSRPRPRRSRSADGRGGLFE